MRVSYVQSCLFEEKVGKCQESLFVVYGSSQVQIHLCVTSGLFKHLQLLCNKAFQLLCGETKILVTLTAKVASHIQTRMVSFIRSCMYTLQSFTYKLPKASEIAFSH